jgi:hypothetical protein
MASLATRPPSLPALPNRHHRNQKFLRFPKKVAAAHPGTDLRVVLDNYGTHKHPETCSWLAQPENKRITLHFTPTGCGNQAGRPGACVRRPDTGGGSGAGQGAEN